MRIAIAQINPTLGDFEYNYQKIIQAISSAQQRKCELVVLPECALFGYHPFDLLERQKLVQQQIKYFKKIEKQVPKGIAILFGLITESGLKKGRPYYNSAALVQKGKKTQFFHKTLLPTGDVFDEARFIESHNMQKNFFKLSGKSFFVSICEDIWAWPDLKGHSVYKKNPIESVDRKKVDLVINLSASPYHKGKMKLRDYVTHQTARYFKAPLMYANLVGSQDEIIFDGASFVIDPKGKKLMQCQSFEEDLNVFDLKTYEAWAKPTKHSQLEELHRALVLGVRDFLAKNKISKVHLGLSGGIDSAVVAAVAVDAIGPQNVTGVALPGPFSTPMSLSLAQELAKNLGISLLELPITSAYEAIKKSVDTTFAVKEFGLVHENIQSRLRGLSLMAYANATGSMLLTTGNKSEFATGYSTLYGDLCGGLAPIGDLTKQEVYQLAELYNQHRELIPRQIITRPPTAELKPNQKDQDSLPPYPLLDQAVINLVQEGLPAKTATDQWLLPKLMQTEFKRWQAPPILKLSKHSFGRGRRYPISHQSKEFLKSK